MIKTIDIDVINLSEEFTILHLSDLHISHKTPYQEILSLIDFINKQNTNIVAITGDLVDDQPNKIAHLIKLFEKIKVPCYFVSGNHELFHGFEKLEILLRNSNIIILDNKKITISINNQNICLVGIGDRMSHFFGRTRSEEIFETLDPNMINIALVHQPKDFKWICKHNIALQLSGHTHGGQIFPFHLLVKIQQGFLSGLYKKNNSLMYVNSGFGTWGIHKRFFSKAEIAIIKIKGK
jgi:predicted MPP superfamily phosphohydrolase